MVSASRNLVELYKNAGEEELLELFRRRVTFYRDLFLLLTLSSIAAALLVFLSFGSRVLIPLLLLIFLPVAAYWRYHPRIILEELAALTEAKGKLSPRKQEEEVKAASVGVDPMMLLGYEGYLQALRDMVKRRE
jgi:hypothetical protein